MDHDKSTPFHSAFSILPAASTRWLSLTLRELPKHGHKPYSSYFQPLTNQNSCFPRLPCYLRPREPLSPPIHQKSWPPRRFSFLRQATASHQTKKEQPPWPPPHKSKPIAKTYNPPPAPSPQRAKKTPPPTPPNSDFSQNEPASSPKNSRTMTTYAPASSVSFAPSGTSKTCSPSKSFRVPGACAAVPAQRGLWAAGHALE